MGECLPETVIKDGFFRVYLVGLNFFIRAHFFAINLDASLQLLYKNQFFAKAFDLIKQKSKVSMVVPGAGLEPAWMISPRDFKSLASTNFATRALRKN